MKIQKENLIFEIEAQDQKFIEGFNISKKIENIFAFYEIEQKILEIKFVYSIEEYEKNSGEKFEKWYCGFIKNGIVFVLSPSIMEQVGIHKKEEIEGIILHEISHILFRMKGLEPVPLFNEGLAGYLGQYEQRMKNIRKINFKEINIENFLMGNKDNGRFYLISFYVVKTIIDKFGKEKLLSFLKELKVQKEKNFDAFQKIFKSVFNVNFTEFKEKIN